MSFAKYCVIYKEFTPTITLSGRNLSHTYKTSLRSFPHFLGSTNRIPTIHTGLPWEAFLIFGIHKSNPNRTYKTSLRSFPHFLGSTNRIPTVHTRLPWKAFLIFWDPQIKFQPYIQDFLEKISSSLRSIYKSDLNHTGMTSFRIFHQPWSSLLKSLSCISQKYWNHFHVFHKTIVEITFMYFTMPSWNHFHVFHKNIVEITFMYFTKKNNVEITFMYFTKPLLKSLSCISQC